MPQKLKPNKPARKAPGSLSSLATASCLAMPMPPQVPVTIPRALMSEFGQHVLYMLLVASLLSAWSMQGVVAQQADSPPLLPKSDVAVTYRFDNMPLDGPHKLQVVYAEAGQRVRVDFFRWMEAKYPVLVDHF